MPDNSFADRFKRLEPVDLVSIISRPEEYQSEAVDAARRELESRQLTAEQLNDAHALYNDRIHNDAAKKNGLEQMQAELAGTSSDPDIVKFGPQSSDKFIRNITIFSALYFLYLLYQQFSFFDFYLEYDNDEYGLIRFTAMFPLLWLFIAGILFGLKRKLGWILLTAFFCNATFGSLASLFMSGMSEPRAAVFALIFGAACYSVMRKDVRELFKANKAALVAAIIIGFVLGARPWVMLMFF